MDRRVWKSGDGHQDTLFMHSGCAQHPPSRRLAPENGDAMITDPRLDSPGIPCRTNEIAISRWASPVLPGVSPDCRNREGTNASIASNQRQTERDGCRSDDSIWHVWDTGSRHGRQRVNYRQIQRRDLHCMAQFPEGIRSTAPVEPDQLRPRQCRCRSINPTSCGEGSSSEPSCAAGTLRSPTPPAGQPRGGCEGFRVLTAQSTSPEYIGERSRVPRERLVADQSEPSRSARSTGNSMPSE